MINAHEMQMLKHSWKWFILFWTIVASILTFLIQTEFLDIPATAGNVTIVKELATKNLANSKRTDESINRINKEMAVSTANQKHIVKDISEIRKDMKEVLKALGVRP